MNIDEFIKEEPSVEIKDSEVSSPNDKKKEKKEKKKKKKKEKEKEREKQNVKSEDVTMIEGVSRIISQFLLLGNDNYILYLYNYIYILLLYILLLFHNVCTLQDTSIKKEKKKKKKKDQEPASS